MILNQKETRMAEDGERLKRIRNDLFEKKMAIFFFKVLTVMQDDIAA